MIAQEGNEVGLSIIASPDMREVYSFGHLEYDRDTLAKNTTEMSRRAWIGRSQELF